MRKIFELLILTQFIFLFLLPIKSSACVCSDSSRHFKIEILESSTIFIGKLDDQEFFDESLQDKFIVFRRSSKLVFSKLYQIKYNVQTKSFYINEINDSKESRRCYSSCRDFIDSQLGLKQDFKPGSEYLVFADPIEQTIRAIVEVKEGKIQNDFASFKAGTNYWELFESEEVLIKDDTKEIVLIGVGIATVLILLGLGLRRK